MDDLEHDDDFNSEHQSPDEIPRQVNHVVNGTLDGVSSIDIRSLALHNQWFNHQQRKFSSGTYNIKYPHSMCCIYKGGRISTMATKTIEDINLSMIKAVWMLRRIGVHKARISRSGYCVDNIVSNVLMDPVDLNLLKEKWPAAVTYNPKRFKGGASITCSVLGLETSIVLKIFASGKVNILGARTREECNNVYNIVKVNVLDQVRIPKNAIESAKPKLSLTAALEQLNQS